MEGWAWTQFRKTWSYRTFGARYSLWYKDNERTEPRHYQLLGRLRQALWRTWGQENVFKSPQQRAQCFRDTTPPKKKIYEKCRVLIHQQQRGRLFTPLWLWTTLPQRSAASAWRGRNHYSRFFLKLPSFQFCCGRMYFCFKRTPPPSTKKTPKHSIMAAESPLQSLHSLWSLMRFSPALFGQLHRPGFWSSKGAEDTSSPPKKKQTKQNYKLQSTNIEIFKFDLVLKCKWVVLLSVSEYKTAAAGASAWPQSNRTPLLMSAENVE